MRPDSAEDQSQKHVVISIRERDDGTCATATLRLGEREFIGLGLSRLSAAEYGSACVGSDFAVARALHDLADRMLAVR